MLPADTDRRDARLRRLIRHAWEKVPFYTRLWDEAGAEPAAVRGVRDLAGLPLTLRRRLVGHPVSEVTARGTRASSLVRICTTGSTGMPLRIWRTRGEQARWGLHWSREMRRAGLRARDRIASLFYVRPDRKPDITDRLSRLGIFRKKVFNCALDLDEIHAGLEEYRPTFMTGLPATLCRVAERVLAKGSTGIRPRGIWVVGENVTAGMQRLMKEAFGVAPREAYGCEEVGLIAVRCDATGLFHLNRRDLILEVLDGEGREAAAGETGELFVTSLAAWASPYIRYGPGDLVRKGPPCPCGRAKATLEALDGRTAHHFTMADGRLVHPWRVSAALADQAADWLCRYQLVQESVHRMSLRVVADDAPGIEAKAEAFARAIEAGFGNGVQVDLLRVDDIEPGPAGKAQTLASRVTPEAPFA